ncbi:MAG: elongation factor G [Bacillota bacterium]|nr:elongation factor G [Bacillota bacterium]
MKEYQAKQIRNVAVAGHGGEGKTTLVEAILFNAGAIDRIGKVEDGSTTTDYDPEEIKRHISISSAMAPVETGDKKINLIDAPGYFDFMGELVSALKLADGALIVISAVSGLTVGAEKVWNMCVKNSISKAIFINQMDRENADYFKVLDQLKARYGTALAPVMVPIVSGGVFKGYVDLVEMKAKMFAGRETKDADIPGELAEKITPLRETLIEAAAESDDELLEKFFGGEELTADEIIKGLHEGTVAGRMVPVCCGAAAANLGIAAVTDCIIKYLPSPDEKPPRKAKNPKTGAEVLVKCDPAAPFAAQVFKTIADPFVGKLSLFRIFSGSLTADMIMYNPNAQKNEKVGNIYILRGKKQNTTDKAFAGDIAAVAKLQHTTTGHTLCDAGSPVVFEDIEFPEPSIWMAISSKKEGEEDKVFTGLHRLEEEDPTFAVEKQLGTSDMLIGGLGEIHLEVICRKLANKFGVEAELKDPKVPYRETIRKAVKAEGKHKKQTGGHGQFGHCFIEFEPIADGSGGFEFVDKVVGGAVPRQYIPAVEKGLKECIQKGVLAGCPVVGIRCTLYDGSFHNVDSSEMAFKLAARMAFRKGCAEANPVLLEPIYHVEVNVPDEYMGDIIGDLNKRRGRILGMNPAENGQQVVAEVPQAEMFKYATDLRSMTQARGSFKMKFDRYEEVPGNISAKVVEQAKREQKEEEE